ncbi:MAG: HEAT repeat domain-containing protein [Acidimicrobiales bacterium]
MAVTMEQVRAVLDPEETDYERGRALGPDALPHLEILVNTADPMLASKAAYLAGLLAGPGSAGVVAQAAASDEPTVRVAAAAAARHLAESDVEAVLTPLLADDDPGVRRVALGSVPDSAPGLRSKVEFLLSSETDDDVRLLSEQVLERLGGEAASSRSAQGMTGTPEGGGAQGEMPGAAPATAGMGGAQGGEMPGASPDGPAGEGEMPGESPGAESAGMPGAQGGPGEGEMPGGQVGDGEMPG